MQEQQGFRSLDTILADGSWESMTDEQLRTYGYAARYMEFGVDEWRVEGGWSVPYRLGLPVSELQRRAAALVQRLAQAETASQRSKGRPRRPSPTRVAPAGTTYADLRAGTGRCVTCGREGYWNPGAGNYLCTAHWDEY
jgi:hypothetical protein